MEIAIIRETKEIGCILEVITRSSIWFFAQKENKKYKNTRSSIWL